MPTHIGRHSGELTTFQFSPYDDLRGWSHYNSDGWMPERYALWVSCLELLRTSIANQLLPVFLEIDAHITQYSGIACTHAHTLHYHIHSTPTKNFHT